MASQKPDMDVDYWVDGPGVKCEVSDVEGW